MANKNPAGINTIRTDEKKFFILSPKFLKIKIIVKFLSSRNGRRSWWEICKRKFNADGIPVKSFVETLPSS